MDYQEASYISLDFYCLYFYYCYLPSPPFILGSKHVATWWWWYHGLCDETNHLRITQIRPFVVSRIPCYLAKSEDRRNNNLLPIHTEVHLTVMHWHFLYTHH